MTDNEVVNRIQSGQNEALGILFERYKIPLYTYAFYQVQDRFIAEDLVQNTFMKVLRNIDGYKEDIHFKGWLFTICRNLIRDHFRKNSPQRRKMEILEDYGNLSDDSRQIDQLMVKKEESQLLNKLMAELDPEKREILTLVKLHEMNYSQVSKITGYTEGNLRILVFRAIKQLQGKVKAMKIEKML